MVELALGIAILAIAVISIISLFWLGLEQNKGSIAENYCAISIEDIFSYLSRRADSDWTAALAEIPLLKPTYELTSTAGWVEHDGDIYNPPDSPLGVYGIKKLTDDTVEDFNAQILIWRISPADWSVPSDDYGYDVSGTIRYNPSLSGGNATEIYGTTLGTIILKIEESGFTYSGVATMVKTKSQGTGKNVNLDNLADGEDPLLNISGERFEFTSSDMTVDVVKTNSAQGTITFDANNVTIVPDPGRTISNPETSAAIFIEISWPVTMAYKLRKKRIYYFEIYDEDNI